MTCNCIAWQEAKKLEKDGDIVLIDRSFRGRDARLHELMRRWKYCPWCGFKFAPTALAGEGKE